MILNSLAASKIRSSVEKVCFLRLYAGLERFTYNHYRSADWQTELSLRHQDPGEAAVRKAVCLADWGICSTGIIGFNHCVLSFKVYEMKSPLTCNGLF